MREIWQGIATTRWDLVENGRFTVSRVLFLKRGFPEFCAKLSDFLRCPNGKIAQSQWFESSLCLLSRNILWIFFLRICLGILHWKIRWIFSGLRFPRNEAQKLLEKFGENSERNSGQKFEKFGELWFCDFADLMKVGRLQTQRTLTGHPAVLKILRRLNSRCVYGTVICYGDSLARTSLYLVLQGAFCSKQGSHCSKKKAV